MKRAALVLAALTLLMLMPGASAQSWEPAWEADLGPGYITTSPLVDDEHVYVRTSGFWTGAERPEVLAFSHDGEQRWTCLLYTSPSPRDRTRSRMPSSA